jgi:N6-adenosine-specific RNA methylase IME4
VSDAHSIVPALSPSLASVAWPFGELKMFGYDFLLIDVPWPWQAYGEAGYGKSPENHYDTMSWEQIEQLPVGQLLRAGGVVWMWGTWPASWRQTTVMRNCWGIEPKTGGAWAKRTKTGKLRWGPGYLLRSVCEPFWIGTIGDDHGFRGRGQCNLIETLSDALVDGLAREHSRKPEEAYRIVEALTPGAFRADVFARQRRPGWDPFGNELGKFELGL